MPKLGQQQIERVYLPSTAHELLESDRAWCDVNSRVMIGDIAGIQEVEGGEVKQSAYALSRLVTAWNLTEADSDNIAAINADNILKLPMADFKFLSEWLASKMKAESEGLDKGLKEI